MELVSPSGSLSKALDRGPALSRARAAHPALLTNVQVLRALAALAVVLFHAEHYVAARRGVTGLSGFDARFGVVGVAVFFAISGYLMARLVRASDPATFLAHRVLRILPPFLVLAVGFWLGARALGIRVPLGALGLTLAPVGARAYPLGVEWTLVCETTFYVLMFLVASAGWAHRIERVAVAWLALIGTVWLLRAPASPDPTLEPIYAILLTPPCAAFAGGLLLPWLLARRLFPLALGLLALPLAVASGAFPTDANRWVGGLAAVLVVGCAIQGSQLPVRTWPARVLVRFGDWSYVLYLVHLPIVLTVLARAPSSWPPAFVWCVAVASSLAAAALLGPLDVKGYAWLKRRLDGAPASRRWRFCFVYLAIFAGAATYGGVLAGRASYRIARVERALARLPAAALSSPETAAAALLQAGLAAPATLTGAADGAIVVTPDQVFLKAWAVDAERPNAPLVLSAYCEGRPVGTGLPGRKRADVAALLARDDLRGRRIGYLLRIRQAECPDLDAILALVSDQAGRTTILVRSAGPRAPE